MLIRLAQSFSKITFCPDADPSSKPPSAWSNLGGRKSKEKVWFKAHLTLYMEVSNCRAIVSWWLFLTTSNLAWVLGWDDRSKWWRCIGSETALWFGLQNTFFLVPCVLRCNFTILCVIGGWMLALGDWKFVRSDSECKPKSWTWLRLKNLLLQIFSWQWFLPACRHPSPQRTNQYTTKKHEIYCERKLTLTRRSSQGVLATMSQCKTRIILRQCSSRSLSSRFILETQTVWMYSCNNKDWLTGSWHRLRCKICVDPVCFVAYWLG